MSARIAEVVLPAKVLKQRSLEDVDLSLLLVDQKKLPPIVVDAGHVSWSHIVSPQVLLFTLRNKFPSLIGDVATTGNSGSGVFAPNRKCLVGIMSRKFTSQMPEGDRDTAKYFVPAAAIREFLPAELILAGVRLF
jgi:hypothetical protein